MRGQLSALAVEPPAPTPIEFNRDVRPILSDNCFSCHGPDAKNRKADLRLDLRDAAVTSEAIVPENPQQSEVVRRILTDDRGQAHAASADSHKQLTAPSKRRLCSAGSPQAPSINSTGLMSSPSKAAIPAGASGVDTLVHKRARRDWT